MNPHGIAHLRRRILIVEDNEVLREMFTETFPRHGFEVLAASTAAEALRLAACHALDAVLTDFDIPDCSGLDLCRALVKQNASLGRSIPLWLMTGSDDPELVRRALAAGGSGVFRKPFSLDDTCMRIRRAIDTAARREAAATDEPIRTAKNAPGAVPASTRLQARNHDSSQVAAHGTH